MGVGAIDGLYERVFGHFDGLHAAEIEEANHLSAVEIRHQSWCGRTPVRWGTALNRWTPAHGASDSEFVLMWWRAALATVGVPPLRGSAPRAPGTAL
jgi:hypothetical protein